MLIFLANYLLAKTILGVVHYVLALPAPQVQPQTSAQGARYA
jgi:hypothetical protein